MIGIERLGLPAICLVVALACVTGCEGEEPDPTYECPDAVAVGTGGDPTTFESDTVFLGIDVISEAFLAGERFIVIDARPPADYVLHHIAGAISLPFYDVEKCVDSLPKDTWIITYCACPHNESEHAANVLLDNGFTKVKVLDEGYIVWRECGYPTTDFPDGNADVSCPE